MVFRASIAFRLSDIHLPGVGALTLQGAERDFASGDCIGLC